MWRPNLIKHNNLIFIKHTNIISNIYSSLQVFNLNLEISI